MKSKYWGFFFGFIVFYITGFNVFNIIAGREITATSLVFDIVAGTLTAFFLVRLVHNSQKSR